MLIFSCKVSASREKCKAKNGSFSDWHFRGAAKLIQSWCKPGGVPCDVEALGGFAVSL